MLTFRSLHLSLRFVIPLTLALGGLAYAVVPLIDGLTLKWFARDLDIRSRLISSTLQEPLTEQIKNNNRNRVNLVLQKATKDERLLALGVCDEKQHLLYSTAAFPKEISCKQAMDTEQKAASHLLQLAQGPVHVVRTPLDLGNAAIVTLVLVHDMSFVEKRSADTRKYVIILFVVLGTVISLITVFVAHLSWRGWMDGVRAMLRGEGILRPFSRPESEELQPLVVEMRAMLRTLESERHHADDISAVWDPSALRGLLNKQLAGDQVLVVSNREPYIHVKKGSETVVHRPASGLVTAVEPVMRACSGTWIAHGSGTADRESVDRHDRVGVPPTRPEYNLRRIWLTDDEEKGYYYGFANEGLWPLCHNAHVRPIFRSSDWKQYQKINARFADAVAREAQRDDPVVLVQDYHFALLPAMIRERLPKATIITFWHIPWPNPESFGICPWREELLRGMLGSTILGFHTPFHCKNFLETVDRYLETRIEHESSTIFHGGKLTMVEDYPISIQWPPASYDTLPTVEQASSEVRAWLGLPPEQLLGVGVDRMDYTKGILERFSAVERMFEMHPELVGRFSFVQIAAPTRSALEEYHAFEQRVLNLADRINQRFDRAIILKAEHHEPDLVNTYYRASNVCMVTSLHDGMNLVAKEFVAARDDEQGVLVLSQFTGAANELHEALIVNPYYVEQTARALYNGLTMPAYEQRERMRSMRSQVQDFNVYRWAGRMLLDAARVRHRERLSARLGKLQ